MRLLALDNQLKKIKNVQGYRDTNPITNADIDEVAKKYEDGNIQATAQSLAMWIAQKMYGKDVRDSLAFWTILNANFAELMRLDENEFKNLITKEQNKLEEKQDTIEQDFKTVQQGATKDDEVKVARNSNKFGQFKVLDDRLENIEDKTLDLLFGNNVTDDLKTLKLTGFSTSSKPAKYTKVSETKVNTDEFNNSLAIQPISKISLKKVSDI